MGKYQITLEVEEENEAIAYQTVAVAIKKKFKGIVRPADEEDWYEKAGMRFDY